MSEPTVEHPATDSVIRLRRAQAIRNEQGISWERACVQAGISRGAAYRLMHSGWGDPSRPLPARSQYDPRPWTTRPRGPRPPKTNQKTPATKLAYIKTYERSRLTADPLYRLYRTLVSRLRFYQHRAASPEVRAKWAGLPAPRMRNKRPILRLEHVDLLRPEEREALFGRPVAGVTS